MKRGTKILRNRIKCKNCGEIIESKTRHDWVCCTCYHKSNGQTGVFCDGGTDYLRRGGHPEYIEDMCETRPYTDEEKNEYNEKQFRLAELYGGCFKIDLME